MDKILEAYKEVERAERARNEAVRNFRKVESPLGNQGWREANAALESALRKFVEAVDSSEHHMMFITYASEWKRDF